MKLVSRYQPTGLLLASAFVLAVSVLLGSLFFAPVTVHAAAPTMTIESYTVDVNTDGTIDRIFVFFSEPTDLVDEAGAADGFGSLALTNGCFIMNGDYSGNGVTNKVFNLAGCTTEDTSITPTLTYTAVASCATNFAICDDAGLNQMANGQSRVIADEAGPVLLSANPTRLKTGVGSMSAITLTFSETPASITTTHSPLVTLTPTINERVVTLTHSARFPTGLNSLTINTAPDAATNAFAGAQTGDTLVANPLTFYVSSNSDDEEDVVVTYGVNLLSPVSDTSVEAGSMTDITWETDGGNASYVNLYYSTDSGSTWEAIVTNTINDGLYTWATPYLNSSSVLVKIVTTDLALELATDTSAAFSIWYSSDVGEDEVVEDEDIQDSSEEDVVPTDIDGVVAGDYIMVTGGSAVYYVDHSMMRRPFFDEQTYFTYENDFDAVVEVSAETLAKFAMGAPMLPKAGVVLVKIQSVAAVYIVEEAEDGSYVLRWITGEDVAEDMFGTSWSSYVVDVDATLFTRYSMGENVDSAESVNTTMMKFRAQLSD